MTPVMKKINEQNSFNGILLVNKPQGKSSNAVLQQVKRLLGAKKAGHTGSLDPLATGMLPICLGEATKLSQYLLESDKCYQTTGLLGTKTDSADAAGKIIKMTEKFVISKTQMLAVISAFQGASQQIPSMYSALKHQGIPLYRYARQGIEIERKPRDIMIHELHLMDFDGKTFSLLVKCSKGTYIRNLVEDIGEQLEVGAHVISLHRHYTSGFEDQKMYTLDELKDMSPQDIRQLILPMEMAVRHLPSIGLSAHETTSIRQGKILHQQGRHENIKGTVRLYNDEKFIGLGEKSKETLKAKRLFVEEV
ncbi:tRNA pseudouridine synthase B [Legionella israelensis]|uniref:tRNA pseudouridine synthase B n=2 Tax=Legionella israelensis TaxID=454 RepID=A0A0W0W8Q5_9GAMM|nr:tRNA pseudouridine synthase B [Legionella israelensis]SCX88457.1 tRNA pseudouridine55 synthase [Legionella israelensis DSM 19235]STX60297.1 tRNA pseudouridine synthase B [Legionella israelensis]